MSTTALAAVVAKLTGLTVAGKTAVGITVAAGCIVAGPAVAHQVAEAPAPADTVVVDLGADPVDEPDPTDPELTDGLADEDADEDGDEGRPLDEERGHDGELPAAASFGQRVAEDARDGGVDGQEIRELAHERNELRRGDDAPDADADADVDADSPDEADSEADSDTDTDDTDTDGTDDTDAVEAPGPRAPIAPAGHGRRP